MCESIRLWILVCITAQKSCFWKWLISCQIDDSKSFGPEDKSPPRTETGSSPLCSSCLCGWSFSHFPINGSVTLDCHGPSCCALIIHPFHTTRHSRWENNKLMFPHSREIRPWTLESASLFVWRAYSGEEDGKTNEWNGHVTATLNLAKHTVSVVSISSKKMFNSGSPPWAGFALNVYRHACSILSIRFRASLHTLVSLQPKMQRGGSIRWAGQTWQNLKPWKVPQVFIFSPLNVPICWIIHENDLPVSTALGPQKHGKCSPVFAFTPVRRLGFNFLLKLMSCRTSKQKTAPQGNV